MKAGWELKTLGDVVKLEYGKPLAKEDRTPDGDYGVYGANGIKNYSNKAYSKGPSIIVGRKGSAGELTYVTGDFWPLDVTYFTQHNSDLIDLKFLMLLLEMANLPSMAKGVKPGINRNDVYALQILLPPLEEQKRIVSILDEAFEGLDRARENAEANLKNARELFSETIRLNLIGRDNWISATLSKCFRLKSGDNLTTKSMLAGPFEVYGGNGVAGRHNTSNLSGDNVIIGRVGALCGQARFISKDIWLTDNAFKVVDYNYDFDPRFLVRLLNFLNLGSLARQTAQPVISNSSLKDLILKFPSDRTEQIAIADNLDKYEFEINTLRSHYTNKLQDISDLRQSLLQKAFAGELT